MNHCILSFLHLPKCPLKASKMRYGLASLSKNIMFADSLSSPFSSRLLYVCCLITLKYEPLKCLQNLESKRNIMLFI